ncbi:Aldehyde/histidinol dehydrogenase [Microdochium trichocladiopsis]|uniref:methylmalonate-semialdehyde dehydrogenase (CoA acylating) n=1 Tax=Microdochium trichocladiopsis TaxID=1682393 RepID=A0A9P8Y9B7_9PEZI|nr:Aldehyde/histidinol dehydrogenase [Microdochium trichocladiopsis]KAH7033482.1 Aldehyde/histidinol dehydrogenase [Microdochium trichocladiopsis]
MDPGAPPPSAGSPLPSVNGSAETHYTYTASIQSSPPPKRPRNGSTNSYYGKPISTDTSVTAPGAAHNFLNNEFVLSQARTWIKLYNPTTQRFTTRVPESTTTEAQNAVAAAAAAQPGWAATPLVKRRSHMLDLLFVLKQNAQLIKQCLTGEIGKTMADAEAEFERGFDAVETACAGSRQMAGTHHPSQSFETHTVNEPLGVCLSITPFNFPFMIPMWSIPYAIIAGNTVVLKPSEKTPGVTHITAQCFLQAGFPPGIINIVHGTKATVDTLLAQPSIRAVSFVGSEIVGERIYEHARATRKRVQAECSGKNHGVVLPDANKFKTLFAIVGAAFGFAGQRCMALSVVVLVGGATREWLADLVGIAQSLVVGSPSTRPAAAKARIEGMISAAEEEGATVLLDGRGYSVPEYPDGNFVGPTILTDVKRYMSCYQEEIFGPVLVCMEVDTLEEAVDLINTNRYGIGCTIFTGSPTTAQTFQRSVNVGQIGVNVPVLAASGSILRTGNKDSFLGDNNVQGRGGFDFFTETKTITTLWH